MSKKASSKAHSSKANAQRARMRAHKLSISRRNRTTLSLFRQLTHSRKLRDFHQKRVIQREAPKGVELTPFTSFLRAIDDYPQRVCQRRKQRRQVLFALGKQGGNHKPPKRTIDSQVRC